MANFITNNDTKELKKRLIALLENSEELKFLVGFFYFSGVPALYEGLKANPNTVIKVLVGLNVDYLNRNLIEYAENEPLPKSDKEKTEQFTEAVKKLLNNKSFDNQQFYTQATFFIKAIENNQVIIRKTYQPNHAKLYLFKLGEHQVGRNNLFITGSSNLTSAGLETQDEFNVEIGDHGFAEAEQYFDDLWQTAVKITEIDERKQQLINTIKKETPFIEVDPFVAFCLVLKTYIDSYEKAAIDDSLAKILAKNNYKSYQYQLDAVRQALAVIENNNGVIVADVVGLGKTIIACAIANQLNKRGLIICPPGLVGDRNGHSGWEKYKKEFKLNDWEVRSLGNLEATLDFVNDVQDIEIVIIDEAHRFRNQDTHGYEVLKNICRGKRVILLTATPFNNRPADIFALLKLFITPKKSSITIESDLAAQFKEFKNTFEKLSEIKKYHNDANKVKRARASSVYKKLFAEGAIDLSKVAEESRRLAKQIRAVIEPVMIRRNRLDLQSNPLYKHEVEELSTIADPKEWFFALNAAQSAFYNTIIKNYFGAPDDGGKFKGAIYKPSAYEVNKQTGRGDRPSQQQRNLFDFMRRIIVKRFESSFGAFAQSIKNFKRNTEICQKFIKEKGKYILDRSLLEKIHNLDADEIEKHLQEYAEKINRGEYPKNHKVYEIDNFERKQEFLSDIESDLQLFEQILTELEQLNLIENDPKAACLLANLNAEFAKPTNEGEPQRKIIIFSEYVDTVKYLERALATFSDKMLVIAGNLSNATITKINEDFDASFDNQENKFSLLLTTDKISEGFNLNRAGMVINYDIPWNPVRVIQRLGRINRISKKVFAELYIVNFFPTEQGAELVQSRKIAANKMFLIHTALGEDSKIFAVDEEPTAAGLFKNLGKNPEAEEVESFYTKALKHYLEIKQAHPQVIANLEAKKYPLRIKVAKQHPEDELLVFFKKKRLYVVAAKTASGKTQPYRTSFEDVFEKIVCTIDTPPQDWNTEQFWYTYQAIQDFKEDNKLQPANEQSLEQKARLKLDFLIKHEPPALSRYQQFLRVLKDDILNYGTLADYTLRRIANLQATKPDDLDALQKELGADYLAREASRLTEQSKEIIIAIENKTT